MDIEQRMVEKLLKDKEFLTICERLLEEGYNADHVRDAYEILDAIEAGATGD